MILEICYIYKEDKNSHPVDSFTYLFTKKTDFKQAVTEAGKYYKTFVRENGWGRKTKLKSIQLIRHIYEKPSTDNTITGRLPLDN